MKGPDDTPLPADFDPSVWPYNELDTPVWRKILREQGEAYEPDEPEGAPECP